MGDQRWHASVRMSQVILLDDEGEARGLTRSEVFLVALTKGIDALRAEKLEAQDRHTSVQKPKAQGSSVKEPKAQQLPTSVKKAQKPSLKKVKAAKPIVEKQIDASEIAALCEEPAPAKFVNPLRHGGMPTNAKEAATMLNAFLAQRGLSQVLSDGPAEASSSLSEQVSEPELPEPVANPFADDEDA